MTSDRDAYDALGLRDGAPLEEVERAYRRLIKQYHPDRPGGDGRRAAELNHAYRHLRDKEAMRLMPVRHAMPYQADPRHARQANRWEGLAMVALAAIAATIAVYEWPAIEESLKPLVERRPVAGPQRPPAIQAAAAAGAATPLPPNLLAIDRAAAEAAALHREGGTEGLDVHSSRCHAALHRRPDLARLDRCAAFDEAAHWLIEREGMEARGRFATPAVIGRQVAGGRLLSNDYLAMESRFDLIRARVAFALAPPAVD